ncbi:type II secretion system F family protein [Nocardiopsis sp. NRRL B-16309]|uniref:type II secretion system F family protein n=1 Tax=Nocardiopsis sp. NRRL B-16309 TaxID=1519494 RepID=UPI0006AE6C1E|nr:type II secretion system F family protein [Nocardiopsis sp. NRRL B-16309]KOX13172.1 type II secretion protein F [Nocardiopsis sp. NRRL B-16309]
MTLLVVCAVGLVLLALVPSGERRRAATVLPPRTRPHGDPLRRLRSTGRRLWNAGRGSMRSAGAREGTARRQAVTALCRVLATELRAGQPPREALRLSGAEAGPALADVTDAESLRSAAGRDPDLRGLGYLAVCWEVAADTGARLADVVDTLAEGLTEQEEQRAEAAARTAGPRTTAMVLSGLPLVGLLMASGLGGSPLAFLFTTPLGLACLVLGVALDLLGAWWTLRMVRSALTEP